MEAGVVNDIINESSPIPSTVKATYGSAIVNTYKEVKKQLEDTENNESIWISDTWVNFYV